MENYYREFGISMDASLQEIQKQLVKERKKWALRLNAADLEHRQNAERKITLLDEAVKVFSEEYTRKKYDTELKKSCDTDDGMPMTNLNGISFETFDAVMTQIEEVYRSGNSNATIHLCNQAIVMGMGSPKVYLYLTYAYLEEEEYDVAISTAITGRNLYPDKAGIGLILTEIYLSLNQFDNARASIEQVLSMNPNLAEAIAVRDEVDIRSGNREEAERKIAAYLSEHPDDEHYRNKISQAYHNWGNEYISVSNNGAEYIASAENYEKVLLSRQKAYEVNPTERRKSQYEFMINYGKKHFDTSLIGGMASGLVIGFVVATGCNSAIPFVISIILCAWMFSSAIEPKWQTDMAKFSGNRKLANNVAYALTTVVKTVWRGFWGAVSALCNSI